MSALGNKNFKPRAGPTERVKDRPGRASRLLRPSSPLHTSTFAIPHLVSLVNPPPIQNPKSPPPPTGGIISPKIAFRDISRRDRTPRLAPGAMPTAFGPLPSAHCLLPTAHCPLPMIIFAKSRGKMPGGCHSPDDHLRSATIVDEGSDGHLCTKPEERRPQGVTPLMAIYGEMAIYGCERRWLLTPRLAPGAIPLLTPDS
jgi:hypothetical protein